MADIDPNELRDEAQREDRDQARAEATRHRPDENPSTVKGKPGSASGGIHATGMPGGGAAIGGIAGTNIGAGASEDVDLEDPHGSGIHDHENPGDQEDEGPPYAGRAGGAVGGTPAEVRATGGRTHGGIQPEPGSPGELSIGSITSKPKKPRRKR